jgi:hypothetical protein
MKSSATLMVISGNKLLNNFMQCADVFEKSKVLGTIKYITANYKEDEKLTLERAAKIIDATKQALEEDDVVSFVHLMGIQIGKKVIKNQGEVIPYINKEVRCISDGHQWFVLAKFIEQRTELKVITNEHMFITGVGINDDFKEIKFKTDDRNK